MYLNYSYINTTNDSSLTVICSGGRVKCSTLYGHYDRLLNPNLDKGGGFIGR